MRLVSTTMTGDSREVIGAAIASVVEWVDAVVVVDTGARDGSVEVARRVAGDKLVVRTFEWIDDFAAARNFALQAAHEAGGEWAVMVDTDERIDLCGVDIRHELARATVPHLMIFHESGVYVQPRFFRLPAVARFEGPTHEAYPAASHGAATLRGCVFRDTPKTPEQLRVKSERDVRILRSYIQKRPSEPRWRYYLGDALQNLGRRAEAIEAFEACASLRGWNEESAWACYRAAENQCALGDYARAVDACAAGLARHPGIAELPWLAAFASYRAGKMHDAVWWARASIALGCFRGCGAQVGRISFRNPMALWEGPYDVLRFALRALGDAAGADEAEAAFQEAKRARAEAG